ncbi:MAG: glycosyltransferase family 1 protein [Saprospiraceae bacterium]
MDRSFKKILIDASNLFDGGGITHLWEFTTAFLALPDIEDISLIIVGNTLALSHVPDAPSIQKVHHPYLDKNIFYRTYFRRFLLVRSVPDFDILFDPGGGYFDTRVPYVTMSRNMLVFEKKEADRYGFSWMRLRLWLLNKLQTKSINGALGVIFISQYAKQYISALATIHPKSSTVIHHGASRAFIHLPRTPKSITEYSTTKPFKLLYVSIIDVYKHHDSLVSAVAILSEKYPIQLTLIGGYYPASMTILQKNLSEIKDADQFIYYQGKKNWSELFDLYKDAEMFVFPSSCENMPNILIEAMSAGLPIVCSDRGPMPEFLKDAGLYFDPEDSQSIAVSIETMLLNPGMRANMAQKAYEYASQYNWSVCAKQTIDFLISNIPPKKT